MAGPQEGGKKGESGEEGRGGKRRSWDRVKAMVGRWWGGRKGVAEGDGQEGKIEDEGLDVVCPQEEGREEGREGAASMTTEEAGSSEWGEKEGGKRVGFSIAHGKGGMEDEGREGVDTGSSVKRVGFEGVIRVEA
eukprot:evm.model.NODE_21450_length_6133_cov_39.125549.1